MSDGAGYSGTPLIRKHGLKSGMSVRLLDPPEHYRELPGGGWNELWVNAPSTHSLTPPLSFRAWRGEAPRRKRSSRPSASTPRPSPRWAR